MQRAVLDALGLEHDRRYMVVDAAGKFITQRTHARLAHVTLGFTDDGFRVGLHAWATSQQPPLTLPRVLRDGAMMRVTVWRDQVNARVHAEGSAWFSALLGQPASLVYVAPEEARQVDRGFARDGDRVGFADGFPLLVLAEASLAALNERLAEPVELERFRPNVVLGGVEAFAEDVVRALRIGEVSLRAVKPCSRCVVITIDPRTGQAGKEPLATLARFRQRDGQVFMGMNVVHDAPGVLRVGDPVGFGER